jgi:hypothetical protein
MTSDILRLIWQKRRLWKKAKNGQTVDEYEAVSKDLTAKIRSAKRKAEKKLANASNKNKKPFYNYVKKKTKTNESVGPLKDTNGRIVTDNTSMANELNKRFSEVFTREDNSNCPAPVPIPVRLTKSFITTQKVKTQIKNLKNTNSCGPDGIPNIVLQQCVDEIGPVLASLYRKSMNHGLVPTNWKQAHVVPIQKKGSKAEAGNYRPVPLTCVCCRVMESVIKHGIVKHLDKNRVIKNCSMVLEPADHVQRIWLNFLSQ